MLFYYDTASVQWSQAGIEVLQRDIVNNQLAVQITHLAEFALGTPYEFGYLPVIHQNESGYVPSSGN